MFLLQFANYTQTNRTAVIEIENYGAISMARCKDYNSASSQFFIVHEDSTFLDGSYAVFGDVTDGKEVVDTICEDAEPTDSNGSITRSKQPVIQRITLL